MDAVDRSSVWPYTADGEPGEFAYARYGHPTGAAAEERTAAKQPFERLATHFRSREAWRVYPDVVPILEHLKAAGVALAVVSNWDSFLPHLLEGHGLSPFFRTVSVSAIEGTGKPEAEIFRRTCERLAVSPGAVLHVGDSPRDDYEGARGAGLRAVLLDRDDRHPHVPERIRSLSELAEIAAVSRRPDLIGSAPTS